MGRLREAIVTLSGALEASTTYGLADVGLRARVNLSYAAAAEDPELAYRVAREGVELTRHLGMRGYAFYMLSNAAELAIRKGDWDWLLPELEEAVQLETDVASRMRLAEIRGLLGLDVSEELDWLEERVADKTEVQAQASVDEVRAIVAMASGDHRAALDYARRSYQMNIAPDATASLTAIRAAAWLGDRQALTEALDVVRKQPGRVSSVMRREAEAALAALDQRRPEALAGFADATRGWRELGFDFEAAVCGLNFITMIGPSEPAARAAADEAGDVFDRLGTAPFQRLLAAARTASESDGPSRRTTPVAKDVRVASPTE
jgi:hypothetical protein